MIPPLTTNSAFLTLYDYRFIAKYVLDAGVPATLAALQDPTTPAGAVLQKLLSIASDKLMAAVMVGDRYQLSDIVTYGGDLRDDIVSGLAIGAVIRRRVIPAHDLEALSVSYKEALEYVEQLRRGERIFYQVPDQAGTGTGDVSPNQTLLDAPTIATQAGRYFGAPAGVPPWSPGPVLPFPPTGPG